MHDTVKNYLNIWEKLNINNLQEMIVCLDENFYFSDPFKKINNKKEFYIYLTNFLKKKPKIKFKILSLMNKKNIFFIKWSCNYSGRFEISFEGISEITVHNNLILEHKDYWDVASNIYAKLPFVGSIFRLFHK